MRQVKSLLRTVKKNLEWSARAMYAIKKKLPAQKSPVTSSSFYIFSSSLTFPNNPYLCRKQA